MSSTETIEDVQADDYSLPQSTSTLSSEPSLSKMPVSLLAERCLQEIERFRRGEPSQEQYGLELFHRATVQQDDLAWERLEQCLSETVRRGYIVIQRGMCCPNLTVKTTTWHRHLSVSGTPQLVNNG